MPRQSELDSQLQDRITAFVEGISALVREAALEAVRGALSGGAPAAPSPSRGRKKAARKATKTTGKRKAAKKTSSGRRMRRSPEELDQLSNTFVAHVRSNPGQRLEQIGAELGIDTSELKRPVQLLMEAGKLRTEGQRRGTTYFTGRGGSRKVAKKKAGKKTAKRKATKRKAGKKKAAKRKTRR